MLPHRIRLKGPWQYEWLSSTGESSQAENSTGQKNVPTSGRVKMPADWQSLFGEAGGKVCFRRRFHCPTNLDPHERVFIVFDGVGGSSVVSVNGTSLGTIKSLDDSVGFDITKLLQPANELAIEIEFDPKTANQQPGGLWAPVVIEIRSTVD